MKNNNLSNTYLVGGAVRDVLLGQDPKDKDYVVVGYTPEDMTNLGFTQVGKDFPVFLHPETGFEYALARKETKTGVGYNGFSVETDNVTLEDDLFRRDLTINAMAMDEQGVLIDPFNGQQDLKNKIIRHVSEHFKEDPVRILRTARFSARYGFSVHPTTISLMKSIVDEGEFDHLTSERVWKEFEKVLTEKEILKFFEVLQDCSALGKLPGFSENVNLDYLKYVETKGDSNKSQKLISSFHFLNIEYLESWKMPSEEKNLILNFKQFQNNHKFYSNLDVEDKLFFISRSKSIHDLNRNKDLFYNIVDYVSWKNDLKLDFEQEFSILNQDVQELKGINYKDLLEQAKVNGEKPQNFIYQAQINKLSPKKGFRLK